MIIPFDISPTQLYRAECLYNFKVLNGSIKNGESNIYGALGEIAALDLFGQTSEVEYFGDRNFDLTINGYKVDVKTKRTTVYPQDHYLCSVSNWNTRQKCDFYMFARVTEKKDKGYLLGYLSPREFYDNAFFKKKGEEDVNGWLFKDDCYNIPICQLNRITAVK